MRLTQCFYAGGLVRGRQSEASAMQQMIDGHCSDTRLHERRIVMREACMVDVIEWGNDISLEACPLRSSDRLCYQSLLHETV